MVAKFERALKAKEQSRWRFERERGAIDPRSLAKLSASPGFRAPFKDRKVGESTKVAVSVLMDLSGSMQCRGLVGNAKAAAMALGMAMQRLGIDCEISGFGSGFCGEYAERPAPDVWRGRCRERLAIRVFKSFEGGSLRGVSLADVRGDAMENPDGEALAWCAGRLAAHPCNRRILMVLSDGEPATRETCSEWLGEDLKSRVGAIEAAGIETVGVGLEDDSVSRFYPHWVVVRDMEALTGSALGKLGEILLAGMPGG